MADRAGASMDDMYGTGGGLLGRGIAPHGNMTPFLRGAPTQPAVGEGPSDESARTSMMMDLKMGRMSFHTGKRELGPMFDPSIGGTNDVYGNKFDMMFRDMDRVTPSNHGKMNNVLPFEQIRVGPSMTADGRFGAEGEEGFHSRTRIMPKRNEELWLNPKTERAGRVNHPHSLTTERPMAPVMEQRRPRTIITDFFGFTAPPSSMVKRKLPTYIYVKPQNRMTTGPTDWVGGAGYAVDKESLRPIERSTTRLNYLGDMEHGVFLQVGGGGVHDYGKSAYADRPNERSLSNPATIGIATAPVEGHMIGMLDGLRPSLKSELIDNPNPLGWVGGVYKKHIVIDPKTWKLKLTYRDITKVRDYTGGAAPVGFKGTTSQTAARRMRLNVKRIPTITQRTPAPGGPPLAAGVDMVHMDVKRLESDQIDRYDPRISAVPPSTMMGGLGRFEQRAITPGEMTGCRLDPDIETAALRSNPLVVPLKW